MTKLTVSKKLRDNYSDYYADGDDGWRRIGAVDKARNVVELCSAMPHVSVVEIGAGDGAVLARLAEMGFGERYRAYEISPSAVRAIHDREIPGLDEAAVFDGYTLPLLDDTFDLAVLSHVIEHVEHPRRLLAEAGRVARHVFVEVPLEDNLRLPRDFVFDPVGHINFYSPLTIRHLLQTCDFEILAHRVTNPSRASYEYRLGRQGWIRHAVKQGLLSFSRRLATTLFTYHSALVGRSPRP